MLGKKTPKVTIAARHVVASWVPWPCRTVPYVPYPGTQSLTQVPDRSPGPSSQRQAHRKPNLKHSIVRDPPVEAAETSVSSSRWSRYFAHLSHQHHDASTYVTQPDLCPGKRTEIPPDTALCLCPYACRPSSIVERGRMDLQPHGIIVHPEHDGDSEGRRPSAVECTAKQSPIPHLFDGILPHPLRRPPSWRVIHRLVGGWDETP